MNCAKLFLSHRLDSLADQLVEQFDATPISPLETRTIFVPTGSMKQWLLLEIAKRKGIAMGLKVVEVERGIFQKSLSSLELFCLIYHALSVSLDSELKAYLDGKRGRLLDLSKQLASLFFTYGKWGNSLFDPNSKTTDWQHVILQKLFVTGPWRCPVQILPLMKSGPVHCFGVDFLPPAYWDFLFRAKELSIYHFSPCTHFWEDLCSVSERRNLNRYWKKRGSSKAVRDELDLYLRQAPPLLANWGKIGRETLKVFDAYQLEVQELYPVIEAGSLLKTVQRQILHFDQPHKLKADDSIKVFLTGSSRLKEIECLREEIIRLVNVEGLAFNEISVLAPDIEPYVPLIEFVFGEAIPYRISGFDIAPQSSFRQGLLRLLALGSGRWEAKEVITLFQTPAFYRSQDWDEKKSEKFCSWIDSAKIKWGIDQEHKNAVLMETVGRLADQRGSWEKGLDRLLDAIVYITPLQINADELEEFLLLFESLKKRLSCFKGEKTLANWADCLEALAEEFLLADSSEEADVAAQSSFRQLIFDLREGSHLGELTFPFPLIEQFIARPCPGHIHASHLHGVRFNLLEEASLFPAKAVFMLGMDEESFPRVKIVPSLDLLKGKVPEKSDQDRYLFLQAMFSAEQFLRVSYSHLSADEGKPVNPSLLVQELMSYTGVSGEIYSAQIFASSQKQKVFWPDLSHCPDLILPVGEVTVSISDLRLLARHPWKFFLQKVHGMYLHEQLAESFNLQKGMLLRSSLDKSLQEVLLDEDIPPGPIGDAIRLDIAEKGTIWQKRLTEWGLDNPFVLNLCEHPPLELILENGLKVRIVGEIKGATSKGLLCTNDDSISGILKCWPEALSLALRLGAPIIYMLKSGKPKVLENPEADLKLFLEYYFRCLTSPSPLLVDWADALLRKGGEELEKKIKGKSLFEDPVHEWVLARAEMPNAEKIIANWGPCLGQTFKGLLSLFPPRTRA